MREYFIHDGEAENGPFDIEQLKSMQINSETPIWHKGLQNWSKAVNVEELKSIIISTSTPPKFSNFAQQNTNVNPPSFNKTSINNSTNKKNILGNIFFLLVIFCIIFVVGTLAISYFSLPSEAEEKLMNIKSDSINKEDERARINAQNTEKNKNYRNNWNNYISVSTNQYSYYEIGGIENLQIIVTNKTEYKIDEITVNVCYEIDNGNCYKTEEITIYNIPPKSQKSESAPNSGRGKNVTLNIIGIYSDKMNFGYVPGNWANNSDDPYFTKK
ncbi:MAG: DUF4339 domain-containing protein [Bacteroidia bacterium]|nr:DUF4339 domain-containing protein [Bacteroidia bacterium]